MFEKKKKVTKSEDLMKKAPSAGAVELGDDVLEAAAGGWSVYSSYCRGTGDIPYRPFWAACGTWPDGSRCFEAFDTEEEARAFVAENWIQ